MSEITTAPATEVKWEGPVSLTFTRVVAPRNGEIAIIPTVNFIQGKRSYLADADGRIKGESPASVSDRYVSANESAVKAFLNTRVLPEGESTPITVEELLLRGIATMAQASEPTV